ncbi:acyl carrier protein [Streptomyces sp. STR69]|uniref:acyl carrier protein n=1 Tax=Streptomyces sp. STR69 TaxID=1796942 RepID=UPI0021C6474F|nr:acyl carrier protein [Streptomyces sp. STR69]
MAPDPYGIRPVAPHAGTSRIGPLPEASAAALDCLQTGLALLADHHHGPGTHLRLGVRPGFRTRPTALLPTVEATTADRLAEARRRLGLRVGRRHSARAAAPPPAGPGPYYTVADAYHLPWVPYHRQRHMEHSFLVEYGAGRATVLDAYHNDTPWGSARPGAWTVALPHLTELLAEAGAELFVLDPAPLDPAGAAADAPPEPAAVHHYVGAYRDHPDRPTAFEHLNLEVWLQVRAWRLHALNTGAPVAGEHAERWQRLSERIYLASRRVTRGKGEPPGLFDEFAALLLSAPAGAGGPVRAAGDRSGAQDGRAGLAVREALTTVLRLPPGDLPDGRPLSGIPGFNSFRMVDILEHIESALGIEVPAGELTADSLRDAGTLRALVLRHLTARAGAAGGRP